MFVNTYETLMVIIGFVNCLLILLIALINSMKPQAAPRAVDFINQDGGAAGGFENKTWDQLDKENRLADLKAQNKELFCAKFKEKFGMDYKE